MYVPEHFPSEYVFTCTLFNIHAALGVGAHTHMYMYIHTHTFVSSNADVVPGDYAPPVTTHQCEHPSQQELALHASWRLRAGGGTQIKIQQPSMPQDRTSRSHQKRFTAGITGGCASKSPATSSQPLTQYTDGFEF